MRFITSLLDSLGCSESGWRDPLLLSGAQFDVRYLADCVPVEALDSLVGFPVGPSVRDRDGYMCTANVAHSTVRTKALRIVDSYFDL